MKPRIDPKDPYAVDLSPEDRDNLARWLCNEIQGALDVRSSVMDKGGDIDYAHFQYEQGRIAKRRWPGAADLPSYLPTEKVDALRSRVLKTIFAEPFSTVDGWGVDAQKAAFIEEFHEWKRKDERLRHYLYKTLHNSLIEGNGVLEVLDQVEYRLQRKVEQFAAQTGEDGNVLLGDGNRPAPVLNDQGVPQPADNPDEQPTVQAATATYVPVRTGVGYRVCSLRDFVMLPGHAADRSDLFGMFKRTFLSVDRIKELIKFKAYDADALTAIGESSDRDSIQPSLERAGVSLAEQREGTAEKELWSGLLLYDCDGDGIAEWYYVTVHLPTRTLLRIRHDDLHIPRFIVFTPFPRPDSVYGYSFVLDKLGTTSEEHTAVRNMNADRSTLATNPPMKRRQGALYDPEEQPWGTGQVIDVRDMDEIEPMEVPDVPASGFQREAMILQAAERLTGVNDTAVGVQSQEKRTATEVQQVAVAGAVRTEEIVENIQEDLEQLDMVRHQLWIRALEAQPDGMPAPESVTQSLDMKSLQLPNGKFTASILRGNIRFKPHGSVATADREKMRGDFNGALTSLAGLAKINPLAGAMLQDPGVVKSIVEEILRLYNMPDKQPFMAALKRAFDQMQQQAAMQQQMAQQGIQPGHPGHAPPGLPPGPPQAGAPQGGPQGAPGGAAELMQMIQQRMPQMHALLTAQPHGGVQ
jgi:hypothetical protein